MIDTSFYLSDPANLERAKVVTGLSDDELEHVVGRFGRASHRKGQLKGKVEILIDGSVVIRHHFTQHLLWSKHA